MLRYYRYHALMLNKLRKLGFGRTGLLIFLLGARLAFAQPAANPDCHGTLILPPGAGIYPPAIPQPNQPNDLVGLIAQNTADAVSGKHIITFGQVFVSGQVQPQDGLVATLAGSTTPVQIDAIALWPDGSVKFAALALALPPICGKSEQAFMLAKGDSKDKPPPPPIDLRTNPLALSVTLDFTAGSYSGRHTVDLGKALQTNLAKQPDTWLRGPLVTQARVDVPLANSQSADKSTLHLTADVSRFADGSAMAEVHFNNDLATVLPKTGKANPQPPLPALDYTATVHFQGRESTHTVSQVQYTAWRSRLRSHDLPALNLQHDVAYLIKTGAVLPYDLATGVNQSLLQSYEKLLSKPDFGQPLAANNVTTYMPMTGGRADIGFTTQTNTVWLLTQDSRAARVALAQSDTSGAIPWNYKLANGRWLTPGEVTDIWVDGRGGPHGSTSGIRNVASNKVWTPDTAHQPNLSYIPLLMTAGRWYYDRQLAQTAFNLSATWPGERCKNQKCNIMANLSSQLRAQAWAMRELKQSAFIARNKSPEQRYLAQTVAENWAYLKTQQSIWATKQGEAAGWLPGDYGNSGATAEWQQDFFTVIAAWAAFMGDRDARQFVSWQSSWLSGRFTGKGMNPYDGCNYNLIVIDKTTGIYLNTWQSIMRATQVAGLSNGTSWKNSGGYYCALARSALSSALMLSPNQPELAAALTWLENANAPNTSPADFRTDPTFNLRLPSSHVTAGSHRQSPPETKGDNLPTSPVWLGTIKRGKDGRLEISPNPSQQ